MLKRFNKVVDLLLQNTCGSCFWIFAAANIFFSQIQQHWRQTHRFLSRTPLKTEVKPEKQPLQLSYKKQVSQKFCKFHRKTPALKSLFNRVAGQETQTQMFSCGVYEIFKNLPTTVSETYCFTWSVLVNKLHFGSN